MEYTKIANLGLSLDKGTNPNYENALPNKVFDYIQAEIPLLVSSRKVVSKLVTDNNIGIVISEINPQTIASEINNVINDTEQLQLWKTNLKKASEIYSWEHEEKRLQIIYKNL